MDNKALIIGLGFLGFMLLARPAGAAASGRRFFRLPNGSVVPESQLLAYGYVLYQGRWVHSSALNQVTGSQGNAAAWQNAINQGFNFAQQGLDLWQQLQNMFGSSWEEQVLDTNPYIDRNTGWV